MILFKPMRCPRSKIRNPTLGIRLAKPKEVEKSVVWTMRFPGDVLTTYTTAHDYQETKRFRVFSEKGWLELDPATDYYRHNMKINHNVPKRGR